MVVADSLILVDVPFEEQPLDFVINRAEPTLEQEVLEEVAPAGDPFALDPATEKKNTRAKKKKSSEEETQKATEEVERERKETEHQPKL